MRPHSKVHGLLFSQVGYEPRFPVRIVVRSGDRTFLSPTARCRLSPDGGGAPIETPCTHWGEIWGSHWWVAAFAPGMAEGEWAVAIVDSDRPVLQGRGLRVKAGLLWEQTVFPMGVEMLESRAVMAKAKCGWMDAGMMWQESNAQSSMILGLLDLLEHGRDRLAPSIRDRVESQVINGCDYLVRTQEKAIELGYPAGALCHDIIGHEHDILPNDAFKAVVAWRRAGRLLSDGHVETKRRFVAAADLTSRWLTQVARPLGDKGLCRRQRGLAEDTPIPADEWPTRDLIMACWGFLEAGKAGDGKARALAAALTEQIMNRQIPEAEPEAGFHGHFREFASTPWSENAWTHSIYGGAFGADAGGTFPNYLLPFIEMVRLWPEAPEADRWRECVRRFAYGYLLPACRRNPFFIVPQGVFGDEGPLWFTGTFHGMNVIYGLTAALAMELSRFFEDPAFAEIAYGNLQWIAGLNAGLTRKAIETGCVIFRTDIGECEAIPVSMIHQIGNRTAGTWFGTRGVICNGFGTGAQFKFDIDTTRANDGPHSLTDEDWIPHSAGWLSGLVRL